MMMMNGIDQGINGNLYPPIGYGVMAPAPLSGTTTDTFLPLYGSGITDSVPAGLKANIADSGLTCSIPISRKRSRDSSFMSSLVNNSNTAHQVLNLQHMSGGNRLNRTGGNLSFLGDDISMQIYQQQLEIDCFIANHTEKVRMEIEDTRKRNSRRIIAAAEEGLMKRLKAKEEEIAEIGKLNWALEEKVKSLCVENQLWRELAQSNEAAANVLRCNLEQLLTQMQMREEENNNNNNRQHDVVGGGALVEEDAESCCGSNYDRNARKGDEQDCVGNDDCSTSNRSNNNNNNDDDDDKSCRFCRNCGKDESCVLLLPCRHLCLCTPCASSINICPICKSTMNGTIHVNLC